jgi:type VI secretion system protein ImpJ
MRYPPVHWYEGLFLQPHHFQAADRHLAEVMQSSLEFDRPYSYGIRSLEYGLEALANHQFEVRALQARMRDGTIIDLGPGQQLDRLDLKSAFETQTRLLIYVGVPIAQLGTENVAVDGRGRGGSIPRYRQQSMNLQDETRGGNDQEVKFKALNLRLLLSTQDTSGYELLPLVQIERAGEHGSLPRLDVTYIPPVLALDAWPGLGRDIVRAISDIVSRRIEILGQQVANRGITFDTREPGDMERLLMLGQLQESAAVLAVLTVARGVHPFVAYYELARIAGKLAVFGKDRTLPSIPPYDHDDLGTIFREMMRLIDTLIHEVRDYQFEQRYFLGVGLGMQVALEPRWFHSDWQWFVGVYKREITEQECQQLLSPGQLDWKLGSSRQVENLYARGAEGLNLVPVQRPPRTLPISSDWIYFEVSRANHAWRDVQETQTLAMRFRESLILNLDRLQGERQIVVSYEGRRITLEFALFAVASQS